MYLVQVCRLKDLILIRIYWENSVNISAHNGHNLAGHQGSPCGLPLATLYLCQSAVAKIVCHNDILLILAELTFDFPEEVVME